MAARVSAWSVFLCTCLLLGTCLSVSAQSVMFFNDSIAAYAKMEPWTSAYDQIRFSFSTKLKNGLLFRATSPKSHIELRLKSGDLTGTAGADAQADAHFHIGRHVPSLADGTFHSVVLNRSASADGLHTTITVTVDAVYSQTHTLRNSQQFARIPHEVYLAGMPGHSKEPTRLSGCISRFHFGNETRQPLLLASTAMERLAVCPLCQEHRTCSNGGVCPADGVSNCVCKGTGYRGPSCQEKSSVVALDGKTCLTFKFGMLSTAKISNDFTVRFRSKSNGTLLSTNVFSLVLSSGSVVLTHWQPLSEPIHLGRGLLASGVEWHFAQVSLSPGNISLTLDHSVTKTSSTASQLPGGELTNAVHVGCAPSNQDHLNGCLQDVFAGDVNLIDISRSAEKQLAKRIEASSTGVVRTACPLTQDFTSSRPVTFMQDRMHDFKVFTLDFPEIKTVQFWFRTNEANAHLMSIGRRFDRPESSLIVRCGRVVLVDHQHKYLISVGSMGNGSTWRHVKLELFKSHCSARLTVDGHASPAVSLSAPSHVACPLSDSGFTNLVFGHHVQSDVLTSYSYAGCMSLLRVNGALRQLTDTILISEAYKEGGLALGCNEPGVTGCQQNSCANNATCQPGWQRYSCDCASTQFTGKKCDQVAPVFTFIGDSILVNETTFGVRRQSSCTDGTCSLVLWSANVRPRHLSGVLVSSSALHVVLADGRFEVQYKSMLLASSLTTPPGYKVSLDEWHTIRVTLDCRLTLTVDTYQVSVPLFSGATSIFSLHADIASVGNFLPALREDWLRHHDNLPAFKGCMSNIRVYGNHISTEQAAEDVLIGTECQDRSQPQCKAGPLSSVTLPVFTIAEAHAQRPALQYQYAWKSLSSNRISLVFSTHQVGGVLLASASSGDSSSSVQITLHQSKICLRIKTPTTSSYRDNCTSNRYADGRPHTAVITSAEPNGLAVTIDNERLSLSVRNFDLASISGNVVLGNTHCLSERQTSTLMSAFAGCIGNVTFGGQCLEDMLSASTCTRKPTVLSSLAPNSAPALLNTVIQHCAQVDFCKVSPCKNEAPCNSVQSGRICSCIGTGYIGETCDIRAAAVTFKTQSSSLGVFLPNPSRLKSLFFQLQRSAPDSVHPTGVEVLAVPGTDPRHGLWVYLAKRHNNINVILRSGTETIHCVSSLAKYKLGYHSVRIILHRRSLTLHHDNTTKKCPIKSETGFDFRRVQVGKLTASMRHPDHQQATGFRGWMKELYVNHFRPLDMLAKTTEDDVGRQQASQIRIKQYAVETKAVSIAAADQPCSSDDEDCTLIGSGSGFRPATVSTPAGPKGPTGPGQPTKPKPIPKTVASTATGQGGGTVVTSSACKELDEDGTCLDGNVDLGDTDTAAGGGIGGGATIGIIIVSVVVGVVIGVITVFIIAKLLGAQRGQFKLESTSSEPPNSPGSKFSTSSGEHFL